MARSGVTAEQVFEAIDEITAAGVRPTVENIRQRLGTGSPNTIAPMLADWFRQLPRRLQGRPSANDAGDLPAAALASFRLFWRDALQAAHIEARKALQHEQEELARHAGALKAQAAQLQRDQDALAAQRQAVDDALAVARDHAKDLQRQLAQALTRAQGSEASAAQAGERLTQLQDLMETERRTGQDLARSHAQQLAAVEERHAATERRHLQEIDRARAETKCAEQLAQAAQAEQREIARKAEEARKEEHRLAEVAQTHRERHAGEIAQRDLELVSLQRQLAETQAALERATQEAAAAQRLSATNEARATELAEAVAQARQDATRLRGQLVELQRKPRRAGK